MVRTVLLYGVALAIAASLLQWLEYRYVTRVFAGEIALVLVAGLFTAIGLWAGAALTAGRADFGAAEGGGFEKNEAALKSLGVTAREYEVLELLAAGRSNKEIARALAVSPNTVKTHLARLYAKLDARRRTEAVGRARALALIP